MRDIAIGDKVRVLSGTEEGVVISIKRDIVEVEIEDGFAIPVLNKDLVVVSSSETEHFGQPSSQQSNETAQDTFVSTATGEVYIGLVKKQKTDGYELSIINHTTDVVIFYTYRKKGSQWMLLASGQLENLTYDTLTTNISDGDVINTGFVKLADRQDAIPALIEHSFRIKPQWLIKEQSTIPLVRAKGYFFPLNKVAAPIDVAQLKNAMYGEGRPDEKSDYSPVGTTLDLHIEELTDTPENFAKNEILPFQLEVFDAHLDKAITAGNDDLTVVHGVGNGTLKHNIQKKLSGHPYIAYFKDAQKEKFGYGALYIKFK